MPSNANTAQGAWFTNVPQGAWYGRGLGGGATYYGLAAFSADGDIAAVGSAQRTGAAALSADGDIAAGATATRKALIAFTADGDIDVTATAVFKALVALTAAGDITVVAWAQYVGSAAFTADGDIAAVGSAWRAGAAAFTADGDIDVVVLLGTLELGYWCDVIEFEGSIYLSRRNLVVGGVAETAPILWRIDNLSSEPMGRVGGLPLRTIDTSTAIPQTVDAEAYSIDAMLEDDGILWAVGWRIENDENYAAVWSNSGSGAPWVLRGQLATPTSSPRSIAIAEFRGMLVRSWGVVMSGPAGIYELRGSHLAVADVASSGAVWQAGEVTIGKPYALGGEAIVLDGTEAAWISGGGQWTYTGRWRAAATELVPPDLYDTAQYRNDIWGFGLIATGQTLWRIAPPAGSQLTMASWDTTQVTYHALSQATDYLLGFGLYDLGINVPIDPVTGWALILPGELDGPYRGPLWPMQREGRVLWMRGTGLHLHDTITHSVFRARASASTGRVTAIAWAPMALVEWDGLFGNIADWAPDYVASAQAWINQNPWLLATTYLPPYGFRGGVDGQVSEYFPPVVLLAEPEAGIFEITLEWADDASDSTPEIKEITLEWADEYEPPGGDDILYLVSNENTRCIAIRVITGGRQDLDEQLTVLVRADKEALSVSAWATYQVIYPADFGANVYLQEPGYDVRIAIVRPAAMTEDPDIHVQLVREDVD